MDVAKSSIAQNVNVAKSSIAPSLGKRVVKKFNCTKYELVWEN
jgi:hypothetical protein